ncbi:hypothetical protein MGG_02581 [Pyricularia oryzae 70-15]|uniref:Uncharacterized protein n=1 Tax=Pyricularia oryzae (strain 70-15 / ATCC MYA-4617 / FGSC 8958) TaxID=242507 RepID=G4NJU6_PYRO7|nr:uncharacterized protein MGG_02581 [Pyricularia oryzae 70-15]EHA46475.1 hypothetical protein MGG_02581 [Pyricularia oryzae 70-15]
MPLFSRHEPPKEEVVVQEPVRQERRGLFGRKRSVSPVPTARRTSRERGGLFNRRRRSVDTNSVSSMSTASTSASPPRRRSTLLSRRHGDTTDPSILAARERIMGAEEAERQADRALDIARREVRDARDQILALEREAKEQARLAKIKEQGAREVSKRGKALGRHGI